MYGKSFISLCVSLSLLRFFHRTWVKKKKRLIVVLEGVAILLVSGTILCTVAYLGYYLRHLPEVLPGVLPEVLSIARGSRLLPEVLSTARG